MSNPALPSLAAAAAWFDDRIGAILVKEARQAVRSRFVVSVQYLFLALLVVTLATVLLNADSNGDLDRNAGRKVFVALNVMLHAVCVACVPLYIGVRLAAERSEANVDLMFSTTLRPSSIIWGKVASGLLVGLLAVSACAPFMVLCYFLRGVDIPTIAFCIAVDLVFLVLGTVAAVFIGALPVGWVIKGVVALAYGSAACGSIDGLGYGMAYEFTRRGVVHEILRDSDGLIVLGLLALCLTAAAGLFFVMSCALITPPTANRALPVRGYLTALWVVSAAVVAALLLDPGFQRHGFGPAVMVWATIWSGVLALGFIVAVSERDALGPRLRRERPSGAFKRKLAFLFYSGAAGGMAWTVGMAAATLVAAVVGIKSWLAFSGNRSYIYSSMDEVVWPVTLALLQGLAMVLAYALIASGIRRHLLARFTRSIHTGVVAVLLMVAGMLLPLLGSFLLHGGQGYQLENDYLIHVFNPSSTFFFAINHSNESGGIVTACTATTVVMLAVGIGLSGAWLLRQAAEFFAAPAQERTEEMTEERMEDQTEKAA